MKINIFGFNLAFRFVLICLLCFGFFYSVFNTSFLFITLILGGVLVFAFFELYGFINQTNKSLNQFLFKLKHRDLQGRIPLSNQSKSFTALNQHYNSLLSEIEKEYQTLKKDALVLSKTLESLNQGILICNAEGDVIVQNNQFCKWFNVTNMPTIDDLYLIYHLDCFKEYKTNISRWKISPEHHDYSIETSLAVKVTKHRIYGNEIYTFVFSKTEDSTLDSQHWQNYIKVISHEIGNGISPIRSVAETLYEDIIQGKHNNERLTKGLKVIIRESDGLIEFSNRYRQFVKIPDLVLETINVSELLISTKNTLLSEIEKYNIDLKLEVDDTICIQGDNQLLKQVFINLFLNSVEALSKTELKSIHIKVSKNKNQIKVSFSDNGCGIQKDQINQVFIPFFTTKPTGSGIGLSLVQQILWKHNARIFLKSKIEKGTVFHLVFNA